MEKVYTILLDEKVTSMVSGKAYISEEGAKVVHAVYEKLHGPMQSLERRQERGGVCWLSEIKGWMERGHLPSDFDWKVYEVEK